MSSLLRGVTLGCILTWATTVATGQEGSAPAADPAAAFKEANAAWDALSDEVKKIIGEYRASKDPAEREKHKKRYEELAATGPARLAALRTAAIAAYKAAPNVDKNVTTAAVRMLADDVRRDDYEAADALAKLLIENKCTDTKVNNFAGVAAYGRDDFEAAASLLEQAEKDQVLDRNGAHCLDDLAAAKLRFAKELAIREKEAKADDLPRVKLETTKGNLTIELFENQAPETVGNFISLVEAKYYDGLSFHRVLPGFMAQGGCPEGTGTGGPGYKIYCECKKPEFRRHFRGTLSMAHAGENTGGSQFFLTFRSTPHLDGQHTAFGRVIEGLEILTKLQRIDPGAPQGEEPDRIVKATVIRKRDHKYEPHKVK